MYQKSTPITSTARTVAVILSKPAGAAKDLRVAIWRSFTSLRSVQDDSTGGDPLLREGEGGENLFHCSRFTAAEMNLITDAGS